MMFDILQVTQKIRDAAKTKEEAAQQCPNMSGCPRDWSRIRQASFPTPRTVNETGSAGESPSWHHRWELTIDRLLGEHDRCWRLLLDHHHRRSSRWISLGHYGLSGVHLLKLGLLARRRHGRARRELLAAAINLLGLLGLLRLLVIVLLIWLLR